MKYHDEFWVNGHHCETGFERRALHIAYINGEKFSEGSNRAHLAQEMINETKWRVERDYDFWKVVRAAHNYIESKDGWVMEEAISEALFPEESLGLDAVHALYELQSFGMAERDEIYTGRNYDPMWRSTDKAIDEVDLEEIDNPQQRHK